MGTRAVRHSLPVEYDRFPELWNWANALDTLSWNTRPWLTGSTPSFGHLEVDRNCYLHAAGTDSLV